MAWSAASCSVPLSGPLSAPSCRPTHRVGCSVRNEEVAMTASVLLSRPGAVAAGGPDDGVAAHYGEPAHEQRALERGQALVDLSHLGVVTISDSDRLTWLHNITSQHLSDLEAGTSTELLVLDPNGRIQIAAATIDDGERTWLITEAATTPALVEYLESMKFAMRVEVTARPDLAVLGASATGPDVPGAVLQWRDPWPVTAAGSTRYGPADHEHPGAPWQGRSEERRVGKECRSCWWSNKDKIKTEEQNISVQV